LRQVRRKTDMIAEILRRHGATAMRTAASSPTGPVPE